MKIKLLLGVLSVILFSATQVMAGDGDDDISKLEQQKQKLKLSNIIPQQNSAHEPRDPFQLPKQARALGIESNLNRIEPASGK